MIALQVTHNGQPVCTAGIGDLGVITTHVCWVHSLNYRHEPGGPPDEHTDLSLGVGGLHTPTDEHRGWDVPDLQVGDTVTIQVVETEDITPHTSAETASYKADPERERDHVRQKAREFGWTIVEPTS